MLEDPMFIHPTAAMDDEYMSVYYAIIHVGNSLLFPVRCQAIIRIDIR